jgi:hypothetical protein
MEKVIVMLGNGRVEVGLGSVNYNENATHPRKWVELKAE